MPSPLMDLKGFSSSSRFSEETLFSGERQVGFWKSDTLPDQNGATGEKLFNASPLSKLLPVDTLPVKSLDHTDPLPTLEQKANLTWDMPAAVQMDRAVPRSLGMMRPMDPEPGSQSSVCIQAVSPFLNGDKINLMGNRYENSLFSSSLSDLFSRKMKLTSNGTFYGHSVDTVASHFEEEEPIESLEELEAQTIGNLLPNDDDLLSGVTDGLDFVMHPDKGDDVEELDLFSSVGGMDLEDDIVSAGQKRLEYPGGVYNGSVAGEHPYGEHPSRTLFVRNINSNVEDSELRALFEQYGDIRTLYTACKHRGFVMISYYDIRAARTAMKALQNKPLRRRKLDIHYSIPKDNPSEKDANQGTLVVFNVEPSVSNDELHHIFGDYGEIKEIRETPHRSNHKFVEFYDVRAAEAALNALDKSDIAGKQIKVEPSRPGGARRLGQQPSVDLEQDESVISVQQNASANSSAVGFSGAMVSSATNDGNILAMCSALRSPILETAFHHGISSSVPDGLPSLLRVGSAGNHPGLTESSHSRGQLKLDIRSVPGFHPHSLPEYHDGLANAFPRNSPGTMGLSINQRAPERIDNRQFCRIGSKGHSLEVNEVFGSSGNGSSPIPGHPFSWGNSYRPQPPSMMWSNSPSFVNGLCTASHAPRLQGLHGAPSQMLNRVLPINSHHVGSAPTVNPSIWDRQQVFAGESPDACSFHPVSLGNMRLPNSSLHSVEFMPHNIFPPGGNCIDLSMAQKNIGQQSHHQRSMMFPGRGQMMPLVSSFDSPSERVRSRRNEGASSQADNKKQYDLDIDRIMRGEDNRTTLMIKNIPNKYTSKMLLAAIDERHRGTYDFIYLPIDFKNKCNVGYAFINMTDPSQIIPFYKAFNGKKWEKFNSEKVASLAYARIQGKAALIAHFQNSSLMNEDKRCRPILFNTEGPNAGDQVPFPMGVNVRTRPGKARTASLEENNQGSYPGSTNGEDSHTGEASISSVKDSD